MSDRYIHTVGGAWLESGTLIQINGTTYTVLRTTGSPEIRIVSGPWWLRLWRTIVAALDWVAGVGRDGRATFILDDRRTSGGWPVQSFPVHGCLTFLCSIIAALAIYVCHIHGWLWL